jgi:phosphatidylethanolamine-binding protein (PEBP) family uncharacterized protein
MLGRSRSEMLVGGALAAMCVLVGCGSSSKSQSSATRSQTQRASNATSSSAATTPQTTPQKDPPRISLPLEVPLKRVTANFTCDGANVSVPIKWSQIPANTVELDLFIFNSKPIKGGLFADWAVAGLKPTLRGIQPGRLPSGAVVGRNSFGQTRYSVCPPKGTNGEYIVLLSALPHKVPASTGFDPNLQAEKAVATAEFEGRTAFSYKRP